MQRLFAAFEIGHAAFRAGQQNRRVGPGDRGKRGRFNLLISLATAGRLHRSGRGVRLDQRRVSMDREVAPLRVDDRGLAGHDRRLDERRMTRSLHSSLA